MLTNFAIDHVCLECQLHVTCELVECQLAVRVEDEFCFLGGIQVGQVYSTLPF